MIFTNHLRKEPNLAKNNLKSILEKEGITQAELAKVTSLANGTINKTCNQKYDPAPTSKHKILNGINKLADNDYVVQDIFPAVKA